MAGKNKANPVNGASGNGIGQPMDKLAKLLALIVVKGEPQKEKIRLLSCAGFSNIEIAELLGLTPNAITVALYQMRKK